MQGNRGKTLEVTITRLFKHYEERGAACQQNFPKRANDGTFLQNHGYDFQIAWKGRFLAFDAKESATPRWNLQNAKLHQVKALLAVQQNGFEGFFLVYFKNLGLNRVNADEIQALLGCGVKSIVYDPTKTVNIDILGLLHESHQPDQGTGELSGNGEVTGTADPEIG